MVTCKICSIVLNSPRAKVCSANACKSKWKLQRNSALAAKKLECKVCGNSYETQDSRQKTCSLQCRAAARHSTNLQKYGKKSLTGVKNPEIHSEGMRKMWATKGPEFEAKRKATLQTRYGVNTPFSLEGVGERRKASLFKNHGVSSPVQHSTATKAGFSSYGDFAAALVALIEEHKLPPFSDSFLQILRKKYDVSSQVVETALAYLNRRDLLRQFRSAQETEIHNFLEGLGLKPQANARPKFMQGLELDLYLPNLKFAVEFHGLAHHSERPIFGPKDAKRVRTLHRQKYDLCRDAGVVLVQIFEDEWRDKQALVKAMITHRLIKLGLLVVTQQTVVPARKCEIRELNALRRREFFAQNHVAGDTLATKAWGLYSGDVLVAALSVRRPWTKPAGLEAFELARFATRQNYRVPGGLGRLLKQAEAHARQENAQALLTYADLRFGSGEGYKAVGFHFKGYTKPNYFYESGGERLGRFGCRKSSKPEMLALGATEREQNAAQDRFQIYDAGSAIYLKFLPHI